MTGLDGEVDSLLGYRSPMHGPRPQRRVAAARAEEFDFLAERVRSWLAAGIEPHAIGVAARSAGLVREAREALKADGITTVSLSGRGEHQGRPGRDHARDEGPGVPGRRGHRRRAGPGPATRRRSPRKREDAVAHAQDLQRERCVLFVACTRARDHLYVSGTGEPSLFLPPREAAAPPPPPPILTDADFPAFDLGRFFRLLLARRRLDPGLDAESFLAWAIAPGRRLRLADLDAPARQFLAEGGTGPRPGRPLPGPAGPPDRPATPTCPASASRHASSTRRARRPAAQSLRPAAARRTEPARAGASQSARRPGSQSGPGQCPA